VKKKRCGGLRKRSGRAAEKGIPWKRPFPQPSLMCSPVASPVVQPAGPLCAARQPADISCFSFGNTALQPARPAGPPFSVILETEVLQHKLSNCQTDAHICCFFACDSKKTVISHLQKDGSHSTVSLNFILHSQLELLTVLPCT